MSANRPDSGDTPPRSGYDVVVIGGGIMGSSVAYWLLRLDPALSVCVLEPDSTYALASTPRASGGARRLFSCVENIQMSQFSIDFFAQFDRAMSVDGEPAPIDWHENGYLFIVEPSGMEVLVENHARQRAEGCEVHLLSPGALAERYPSMRVDDLGGGVLSPRDGWCDPSSLLRGFRRKAIALGADYIEDRAVGIERQGPLLRAVRTGRGRRIAGQHVVNAAGPWAGQVAAMAGMMLPIEPQRRFEHFFSAQAPVEPLPYVKDLARLAFRPEGKGYSGGLVDSDEPWGFDFEVDHGYFERIVWPALAHRFPGFEAAKCHRTWAGLYEVCTLDGNAIIGNWPGVLDNFHQIGGFSGHGMMHAPAAGRAVAELVLDGRFRTLDLSRLGYARVVRGEPYAERGII